MQRSSRKALTVALLRQQISANHQTAATSVAALTTQVGRIIMDQPSTSSSLTWALIQGNFEQL